MRYPPRKIKKFYRVKRGRKLLKSRFFWLSLLVLIVLLVVFYLICFHSFFQIEKIEISGNQKVSTEDIRNLVEVNLPKKILFFNSKSILLANLKEIEGSLLNKFSKVGKVDFDRNFPDKLIVLIEERKPVAIFERGENLFFIDEQGITFEKVSEKGSWLIIKDPNLNREIKLGEKIIEKEKLSQILKIKSELRESEIKISSAEIVSRQRVNIETLEGWEIYFNLEDDISQQVFNLDLVLKEKISLKERENLEYVDLRFGNQVYYK